jgi:peroxiredoxin
MSMRSITCLLALLITASGGSAQKPAVAAATGWWRGQLHREDGHNIIFNFEWTTDKGKIVWFFRNASERIRVTDIQVKKDSVIVQMPLFESQFRLKKSGDGLTGNWIKGGAIKTQVMRVTVRRGGQRFDAGNDGFFDIHGRWSAKFITGDMYSPAIAEFTQHINYITGTFLNPTGDYRYLEGLVSEDSLKLSCFDGSHAYFFTAKVEDKNTIRRGWFYSGATHKEEWVAEKNDTATLPAEDAAMYLRPGEEKLHFSFKDLGGKTVSINDERFKNKVVVVQLMGSWCPNCMDETAFLSDYYNHNRQRGIEIVSLAYEYSTDRNRSVKTLKKFQQRFNVQYPMLITGVTIADSLRTEKTLPELTPIKFFPSSVVLDKQGRVRKLDTGFQGPGTGEHYLEYKREFEDTINRLLREH